MNPNELKIQALVNDLGANKRARWTLASELTRADVYVTYAVPNSAARSLQRGTLFIRSTGD